MSIGSVLNMARSGMAAQQAAVQTASQNISNAQTAGYSRQRVEMATSLPTVFPYGSIGTGISIQGITRARDTLLDATYRTDAGAASNADTTASALTQIQSMFGEPSDTGLSAALDKFWSAWNDVASDPSNTAAKSVVREAGANVASTLNRFAAQLDRIDQDNRQGMSADVAQVNELSTQIGAMNKEIISAESNGHTANDLRDSRDRLVDSMSKLVGGQVVERSNGSVAVYVGGRMLVDGTTVKQLGMTNGQPPTVAYVGGGNPLTDLGGSLGARIDLSATKVPSVLGRLDSLASGLATTVNAIHSSGKLYTGTPPVASAAGNFFAVTTPTPSGGDLRLTARGIQLDATMTSSSAVASAGSAATGPGNNDVALAMAGLRDTTLTITDSLGAADATATVGDFFNSVVGEVATATKQAEDDSTVQNTLASSSQTRRESVSGVSTDEELIAVIQHQHAYQAAARLITVVDQMTQTLVDLGR